MCTFLSFLVLRILSSGNSAQLLFIICSRMLCFLILTIATILPTTATSSPGTNVSSRWKSIFNVDPLVCDAPRSQSAQLVSILRDGLPNSKVSTSTQHGTTHRSSQSQYSFPTTTDDKSNFFVIATIFNPASYKSRYELYHQFSRHMKETGAQLITVECIFPLLNQTEFQVTDAQNPFHVQLTSKSVYWMKENLINIAVARLPAHAQFVSWLDADIHFHNKNWIELTMQQLTNYTVVQIFETCKNLGPSGTEVLRLDYSFGYSVVHGKIIDQESDTEWFPHPGYGWAMSVSAFRRMKGLPIVDILGSGDEHFAYSLINRTSRRLEQKLKLGFQFAKHVLEESAATFRELSSLSPGDGVTVGYVPVAISHHWHGSREDRQYRTRSNIFIRHNFNIKRDMKESKDGLLEFIPGMEQMQQDIVNCFQKRKEDALEVKSETRRWNEKRVV